MGLLLVYIALSYQLAYAKKIYTKEYITNPHQSDGFGSQFQSIIAAVVYAELNNKEFVYTPFSRMEHNYQNDPYFLAKKEQCINFIGNVELNKEIYNANEHIKYKAFFDTNIKICANSTALQKIKQIFRANKNRTDYFNNKNLNIAIHIRRHNIHDNRIDGTNTPNQLFLDIINQLRILYITENPLFHIYSQGNTEQFKLYEACDIVMHLNESIEDTFIPLVFADILVTSASSFSYTAALLSDGIVYYIPFWHKPLPHWISVHELLKK